jgi:RIO kinase 1
MPKQPRYDYDDYAGLFDSDRQARRKRKAKAHHVPKKQNSDIIREIADTNSVEMGIQDENHNLTYQPSLYEAEWLYSSLNPFFEQSLITDVLSLVKGGKEANVYCCEAHPSTGVEYLAAKVYRPRQFRNLSNDAVYREGRDLLDADGKQVHDNDKRSIRAIDKKTNYGVILAHTSWLMHEYRTLSLLHEQGVNVPQPYGSGENAILLEFIGEHPHLVAPTLHQVRLPKSQAQKLFKQVMDAIETMLQNQIVHGDLSAYNILFWDDEAILIDFPQVVNSNTNSNTHAILKRDIQRVCDYFKRCGVHADGDMWMSRLWKRYLAIDSQDRAADLSRYEVESDDE